MHASARALSIFREFFQIPIEMREGFVFNRTRVVAQTFPIIDGTDGRLTLTSESHDEIAQRAMQLLVAERFQGVLIESVGRAIGRRICVFGWVIHTEKQQAGGDSSFSRSE